MSYQPPPIYLVSLEQDITRRHRLEESFPENYKNFIHIKAVDGRKLTAKDYHNKTIDFFLQNGRIMSPAELGCTLSHINALEQFLKTDHPCALILEDDVIGNDQDIDGLAKLSIKLDSNSLLLCGAQQGLPRRYQFGKWLTSKGVYEVCKLSYPFIFRTCCYLVTRKSAQEILDYHAKHLTLADKWNHFFEGTSTKIYYVNTLSHPKDLASSHIEDDRAKFKNQSFAQKLFSINAPMKIFRKLKNEAGRLRLIALGTKQLP